MERGNTLVAEVRKRADSAPSGTGRASLVERLLVNLPLIAVLVGTLVVIFPIWLAGYPWGSDTWGHLQTAAHVGESIRQYGLIEGLFQQSQWMTDWYMGHPVYVYYPPLSLMLLGPLTALVGDVFAAYRIFVTVILLGLSTSVFWIGVRWGQNAGLALIGALLAVLSPYTLHTIFAEGNLGRALALVLLPWLLWFTERLLRERVSYLFFSVLAALWALAILAHVMQAVIFAYALAIYVVLRSLNNIYIPLRRGLLTCIPIVMGGALAAFYLLPAYSQAELPGIPYLPAVKVDLFSTPLGALFPFNPNIEAISVGVGIIGLSLLVALRGRRDFQLSMSILGLVCIWLSFGPGGGLYQLLPLNQSLLPERFLNVSAVIFPLIIASTSSVGWRRPLLVILVAAVVLIDGLPALRLVFMRPAPPAATTLAETLSTYAAGGRIADFDPPTAAPLFLNSVIGGRSNISGWSLENTPHHWAIRRLLSAADLAPEYVQRMLSLWNTDYLTGRFDSGDQAEQFQAMGFNPLATSEGVQLWARRTSSSLAQQLSAQRMLVIGENATDWLYTFPFASEGFSPNIDDYDVDYLQQFSVVGLTRLNEQGDIEGHLREWVSAGNTLIVDLSGFGQLYNRGYNLFGIQSIPFALNGAYSVNWSPDLSEMPRTLDFNVFNDTWIGATYYGLENVVASVEDRGESYPILGYQTIGGGRVWFVGFNLIYLLNETRQFEERELLREFLLADLPVNRALELPPFPIEITRQDNTHLEFRYDSPTAQQVVLSMTYFPRWFATLDGAPLSNSNHEHLMLLTLPAGAHTVRLEYYPFGTGVPFGGITVSLFSVTLMLVAVYFLRQHPTLSTVERANAFIDRVPQMTKTTDSQVAPCPNCGFRLAALGAPTIHSYPFNALDCPICGFSLSNANPLPQLEPPSDFEKRRLANLWLRNLGVSRSQFASQFGFELDELFGSPLQGLDIPENPLLLAQQEQAIAQGNIHWITSLVFSPDNQWFATSGRDRSVRLWNVAGVVQFSMLRGHSDSVNVVAFSPDKSLLASGGDDHTIRLWQPTSGAELHILSAHLDAVDVLEFNPAGTMFASGGRDRTVRLWSVKSGAQLDVLRGHQGAITALAFDLSGQQIATGGIDSTIRLWNVQTGKLIHIMRLAGNASVLALRFDETLLFGVGSDGTLTLWDVATGKQLGVRQLERTSLQHAAFTANGALLGVVAGEVYLIDTHTGEELVVLQRDEVDLTRIAFSSDGTLVAAVCADGSVRFWDVQRE